MNKKYLPFILLGVGILVFIGAVLFIRRNQNTEVGNEVDDGSIAELPADQRPTAVLLPKSDGHWLKLKVTNIDKVKGISSMDYELIYKVASGQTQGVPGTIQLNGQTSIDRDLLLGSESSGKFRYDAGVETGTLTLRFRDGKGKLLGKLSTDWHFQTGTTALTSVDGKFKYTLDKAATGVWFVTMQTFGEPEAGSAVVTSNDYSIFASDGLAHSGK